jgi:hypothetical protein
MDCDLRSIRRVANQFKAAPVRDYFAPQFKRKASAWDFLTKTTFLSVSLSDWLTGTLCVVVILACAVMP